MMTTNPHSDRSVIGERQITFGRGNHLLTNTHVWSYDGRCIYYDVRSDVAGSLFDGNRIERVHVESGEVELVYQAKDAACVGVVTASPVEDKVVFIHGPEHPSEDWQYSAWHRRGVLVKPGQPQSITNLDARDIVPPYTPGALRGGTHVHVFSGDGRWVSFTYEDHVLATSTAANAGQNQRNVGVSVPVSAAEVPATHPRNHDGSMFSVLVTQTSDAPPPGSDQITRAYSDAWIGNHGYHRRDGSGQSRALAFIGDVVSDDGRTVPELFMVDIPDDVTVAGDLPLCGTPLTRPAPPQGTVQRRLTFTTERKFPGLGPVRHWPRSSPDGSKIAFLMRDDAGRIQLWLASPTEPDIRQLTDNDFSVESAFTFRSDGLAIACVAGGRVCEVDILDGKTTPLTSPADPATAPRPEAVVYSPNGKQVAYMRPDAAVTATATAPPNQIFIASTQLG
ncbi:hypothetical protein RMSM_01506 [Rhodopirellula maiorica SM1]|uniref:ATP/GTP-binding protein n=1 Tax=Rhodopirellula maiorica SM1 TaxID=1265738 RepID=M5RQF1_9BACT|nr:DUF3748 domain-containing protein [Rhodopirellula maiorica]EMI21568.1 hypothetical protein RMSM_01506 [Rhodopirellula maiorica SM1]